MPPWPRPPGRKSPAAWADPSVPSWVSQLPVPKIQTLTENFLANDLSTLFPSSFGTVTWSRGQVAIKCDTSFDSGLTTGTTVYDLTASYIFIKLAPYQATSALTTLELAASGNNNYFYWGYSGGVSLAEYVKSGVSTSIGSLTYNATNHAWYRIRESGGTVFFDTAPDGLTWTNQFSVADTTLGFDLTHLAVAIEPGDFGSDPAGTSTVYYINVLPPVLAVTGGGLVRQRPPQRYTRALVGNNLGCGDGNQGPGNAVVVALAVNQQQLKISRRYPTRVLFRGLAAPPQLVTLPLPPPRISRRTITRAYWRSGAVPTTNQSYLNVTRGFIALRPKVDRAYWRSGAVPTTNQTYLSMTRGTVTPRPKVDRAYWRDGAVPTVNKTYLGITNGLVRRRAAARAIWRSGAVPTVNTVLTISGAVLARPILKSRTSTRALWRSGAVATTNKIYLSVTGGVVTVRPKVDRAYWRNGAVPTTNKSYLSVTRGAIIQRPKLDRTYWRSGAVPTINLFYLSITNGLVKRRTTARAVWRSGAVPTIDIVVFPAGTVPPKLILRSRTATRVLWRSGAVPTANSVSSPNGSVCRQLVMRPRTVTRGVWHSGAVPTINKAYLGTTNGLVRRRSTARATWRSGAVPTANQTGIAVGTVPPKLILRPRTATRVYWHSGAVPTVNKAYQTIVGGLVRRRVATRASWAGTVVGTANQLYAVVTGGVVKRRTASLVVWRGTVVSTTNPVAPAGQQPGGLIRRRTTARGSWRGTVVQTVNHTPGPPGSAPGGVVVHRSHPRGQWRSTIVTTVNTPTISHLPELSVVPQVLGRLDVSTVTTADIDVQVTVINRFDVTAEIKQSVDLRAEVVQRVDTQPQVQQRIDVSLEAIDDY
jgi:hypothetical protein